MRVINDTFVSLNSQINTSNIQQYKHYFLFQLKYFYSEDNKCQMYWSLRQNIANNFSNFSPYYPTRNKIGQNLNVSPGVIQPQHMWKINDYYKGMVGTA